MLFDSMMSREWKTPLKGVVGIFSLLAIVLIFPRPVAAIQIALVRASDGDIYQIRFPNPHPRNIGEFIDDFSIYDATGTVELCPGNTEHLTRELYTAARVLAQTPRTTPLFDTSALEAEMIQTGEDLGILNEDGEPVDTIGIIGSIVEEMVVDEIEGQIQSVEDPHFNFGVFSINLRTWKIKSNIGGPDILVRPVEFLRRLGVKEIKGRGVFYAFSKAAIYANTAIRLQELANRRAVALWDAINAGDIIDSVGNAFRISPASIGEAFTINEASVEISDTLTVSDPFRLRVAAEIYQDYAQHAVDLGVDLSNHEGPVATLANQISIDMITDLLFGLGAAQDTLAEKAALDELDAQLGNNVVSAVQDSTQVLYSAATSDLDRYGFCAPDLIVKTLTMDKSLVPGGKFTLSTTVENQGPGESTATTLHYYKWDPAPATKEWKRLPNKTSDVEPLSANDTHSQSINLTAPDSEGTHYYRACVVKVTNESDTSNNCAEYVTITVESPVQIPADAPLPLYWTDFGEIAGGTAKIQRANLNGTNVQDLVTNGLWNPSSVALDFVGGKMYWTDNRRAKIQRANLDGTNVQDLVTKEVRRPVRIALDVVGGKMYWTDAWAPGSKIQRSNLDGTNVQDLVTFPDGLNFLSGIALDIAGGKMYWTDIRLLKIQRANLDGSNVEDLVTSGLNLPSNIALDVANGKMYWTDSSRIQRANLDGSNVEDLVAGGWQANGIALDVASGKMYWTTINPAKIQRADLDGGNIEDVVTTGLVRPYGITLNTLGREEHVEVTSSSDLIPGQTLATLYWTDWRTNKIQRASVNGTHVKDLVTTGLMSPYGIVLDVAGGKMYWADAGAAKIQRADLNGSNVENLIPLGLSAPICIALDVTGGKMYWTDRGTGKIQRANLDGSNVEDLVFGVRGLHGLALDVANGKMYWTDNDAGKIQRANLNGARVEDLVTTGLQLPNEIALDVANGKMYWTDDGTRKIQRANLNGSHVQDLVTTGLHLPVGIALDIAGSKIYWTDVGTKKIQRANFDGSNVQDLVTTGLNAPFGITLGPASTLAPRVVVREDVNGDGVVDLQDVVLVTQRNLDINGDGVSDMEDRLLVIEAMVNAGGAPAAQGQIQQLLTAEQVQQWLTEAALLGEDSHVYWKGILVLTQLLALLTPQETALLPNYPNPFNPETWIPYQIAEPTDVTVHIYAANGHLVRTLVLGHQPAGVYQRRSRAAYWDGRNEWGEPVASGVYFYTLTAGDFTATRKLLIRK